MRIQHNIMAMNAYRNYTTNTSALSKNLEKLSSGYKINRAGDDAAGLAISEKMRAQITGLEVAQKNAKDGISLVQTAEGALTEVHDMLNRMVELANQSANGTYDNETDRDNLQKEMDQLRSEIDRIADSANFNGINLLDGSLGLNSNAFDISALSAISASDGKVDLSELFSAEDSERTHFETEAATGTLGTFTIDLNNLDVEIATSGSVATLSFSIFGETIKVSLTATQDNASFTATAIATELATALKNAKSSDASAATAGGGADAFKVGNAVYDITDNSDGTVTLTLAGFTDSKGKYAEVTASKVTKEMAAYVNNQIGDAVSITASGASNLTGDVIHATTQVQEAKAQINAGFAGIDLELTADMIKDGATLKIDGHTFTFKVGADGKATAGSGTLINLSAYEEDDADLLKAAANALSRQTVTGQDGREWKIGVDGTTIHIEQTESSDAGKEIEGYDDLTGLISFNMKPTAAKNAGTQIAVKDSAVNEGDTLTINGKKFVFTNDADKLANPTSDTIYVAIEGGAGQNLSNALTGAGINNEYDADKGTITMRAATANDAAPQVLGAGLTLQIGDTSDDWNQLNVAVQDMHVDSLGIDKIKISDQVSAQDAVSVIKDAINMVSSVRGTLGATQNRLDHTINNLSVMTENIQDAESTIRDTDVAEEMMAYTKNNILVQSAQAMLAQANQVPQGVLQLLQ